MTQPESPVPAEGGEPEQVEVLGIDVTPYDYAIWCSVGDGKPFANTIEHRSWSDDGQHIWLMLGTHNFYKCKADEPVRVLKRESGRRRECSKSMFGCDCASCFGARRPAFSAEDRELANKLKALPKEQRERIWKLGNA